MRPSDTERGKEWLTNFLPEDRTVAEALVNSISFTSLSSMRAGLVTYLSNSIPAGTIQQPAVLIPALSIEDIHAATSGSSSQGAADPPSHHVAYETFAVGGPIPALPGSEGFIGNLLRDLTGRRNGPDGWLNPNTSLEELRQLRCRSIVIVTDYAGSGNQLAEYARTFARNRTVRSWRSGDLVQIHAVTYAASTTAVQALERAPIDRLHWVVAAPTFGERPWSAELRSKIEQLCIRTARRRRDALGFHDSKGLFATEAGAPNNLPWVLRNKGVSWKPFFEGRTVPPDLVAELGDYEPQWTATDLASVTRQERLAHALDARPPTRRSSRQILQLLAHLANGEWDDVSLASKLGATAASLDQLKATLLQLALVDADLRLTSRGQVELANGKRAARAVVDKPTSHSGDYYPSSMR